MFLLYDIAFSLALLLLLPFSPLLCLSPRVRGGFWQRFGILPRSFRRLSWVGQGSIWIHAASLGEVNAILPVVDELEKICPKETFIFTSTSYSGVIQARKMFPQARAHLLLPLDLPLFLNPWLKAFEPKMVVVAETELWPNFLNLLKQRRCLILVANGRLTKRSFDTYQKLHGLFNPVIRQVDTFAMQDQADAKRVLALGAHPQRVLVTGNTKYDTAARTKVAPGEREKMRDECGFQQGQRVLAAGSTRPGEEKIVLEAFNRLRRKLSGLRLLLAPRHLERLDEVKGLIKAAGLDFVLRSDAAAKSKQNPVLLLDTQGELARLYALAEIALVGGSLKDFGGQNPLEPAAQGVPVVFGPFMRHFQEIAETLLAAGAARKVGNPARLAEDLESLFNNPEELKRMGEAGRREVARRGGAAAKTAELAGKLMLIKTFKQDNEQWRVQSATQSQKALEFGVTVEKTDS